MTTTITINSDPPAVIELLQLTPAPLVDVVQPNPPRVNIIGMPGGPGPTGPPGPQGDQGPAGTEGRTTRVVILPIPGGYGPIENSAIQDIVTSVGDTTTNAPPVTYYQNSYDPDVDQTWFWSFMLPGDYDSGGTLRLIWGTEGTSIEPVVWKGATCIGVIGTTDADVAVFDAVAIASDIPSSTQGVLTQTTIDLTMDNAAANRPIIVMQGRDADNILDTNVNFAVLLEAAFEYERL